MKIKWKGKYWEGGAKKRREEGAKELCEGSRRVECHYYWFSCQ